VQRAAAHPAITASADPMDSASRQLDGQPWPLRTRAASVL